MSLRVTSARLARFLPGPMAHLPLRRLVLRAINQDTFSRQDPAVWHFFLESSGRAPIAALAHQVLERHPSGPLDVGRAGEQPDDVRVVDRDRVIAAAKKHHKQHGIGQVEVCGCRINLV